MNEKDHSTRRFLRSAIAALLGCCVLFSLSVPLFADGGDEYTIIDPISSPEGYASFLYDNTKGLPTSEANAIAETSDGFIWIGSYGGLIRYDGNSFERYKSTTGIASVVSLYVDDRDLLWIGTNDNGAAIMDRYGNVKMFNKKEGLPSSSVREFAEDDNGNAEKMSVQEMLSSGRGFAKVVRGSRLSDLDKLLLVFRDRALQATQNRATNNITKEL